MSFICSWEWCACLMCHLLYSLYYSKQSPTQKKKTPRRSHVAWVFRQNGSCLHLGHNKVSHTRWDIHSYLTPQLYATSTRNRMNSHPFYPNITYQMAFANCNTSKDTNNWNNKRQSEYKFSHMENFSAPQKQKLAAYSKRYLILKSRSRTLISSFSSIHNTKIYWSWRPAVNWIQRIKHKAPCSSKQTPKWECMDMSWI